MASIPVKAPEAFELIRRDDDGRARTATGRKHELETLMAMADVIGAPPAETALPSAGTVSRRGAFEPVSANDKDGDMRAAPIGDYERLSAAFILSNRQAAAEAEAARIRERHGDLIARLVRTTTPKWYDNWTAAAPSP